MRLQTIEIRKGFDETNNAVEKVLQLELWFFYIRSSAMQWLGEVREGVNNVFDFSTNKVKGYW